MIARERLPFEEQIQFFRDKKQNLIPTEKWSDVWQSQHDRAFMVAGAAKADLLSDMAGVIDKAIAEGKSIDWFRNSFDAIADQHGWAYKGERMWRTRVIYQTNMATSYAAGRLAQLRDPELQQLKPYWMYNHNDTVASPRPLHQSWHGITLPADDPWFLTHYAPNGWGCQCYITAVSEKEAQRLGGRLLDTPPDDGINPKTGAPNGIDKGWDYMPGNTVADGIRESVAAKLDTLPLPVAGDLAIESTKGGAFAKWMEAPDGDWPIASMSADDATRIGAKTRAVRLSADTMRKQLRVHPELTAEEYAFAQQSITHGTRLQDSPSTLIYLLMESGHVTVVKATVSGKAIFMSSFRRLPSDLARRDREIRRLLKKGNNE